MSNINKEIYRIESISYRYNENCDFALNDISFNVSSGEQIAILGANASGKSTLMHLLNGLYFPEKGYIKAFGQTLTEESVETPPFSAEFRQKVGFLFQNSDAQLFNATVEEELAFGPLQLGLKRSEVKLRINEIMQLMEISHLADRSPNTLSSGEKKKVALAGLLTCAPHVILLDEPTAGLDPRTQQWLVEFMGALNSAGVTLITASHDLSFVAEISKRVLIISEDHRLVYDGTTHSALADLDMLLAVNLIHAHKHRHGNDEHTHPHLHQLLHNHEHD